MWFQLVKIRLTNIRPLTVNDYESANLDPKQDIER
jgi:hypothetical protein